MYLRGYFEQSITNFYLLLLVNYINFNLNLPGVQLPQVDFATVSSRIPRSPARIFHTGKSAKKPDLLLHYSLLQDAESKSETSQAISAREHFVFTDTDGQVYHITVEGNTVKDGARIPPDVSPETMCHFYVSFCFISSWTTSRSSTLLLPQSYSYPFDSSPSPFDFMLP